MDAGAKGNRYMIEIVHVGLGPLGQEMVRSAVERESFRIVGAVDIDPAKAGKDLGELCGVGALGVPVSGSLEEAIRGKSPRVAVVTTVSSLAALEPQLATLARAGLPVVSTCEELFFPWRRQPQLAHRIDRTCRDHGIACVGTGVNPGFLMDYLPAVLTGLGQKVTGVRVWRIQDASVRRVPFQQKIGAGLTTREFEARVKAGTLRHVGLPESVDFIAARLGWELDQTTESIEPVMADQEVKSGYKPIAQGMVRGVYQVGRGFKAGEELITLTFRAAVGEPESYEEIRIEGEPAFRSCIAGGVNGDIATCAVTLNAVRSILAVGPGLKTMADLPTPSWFAPSV
jgi:4-hydroxy-tetrahydrodipicolinate reductase